MKYSVAFLLASRGVAPRVGTRHRSAPIPKSPARRCASATATTLLSAAISAEGASHGDGVHDNRYGPAITVGKLKINIFGIVFGLWEVFWGICFWYPVTALYGLARVISSKLPGNLLKRVDPCRRVPVCVGYVWALLSFSPWLLWPKLEGLENLESLREVDERGKKGKLKPAMYVANHSSWMDIVFAARVLRFLNYKMIAKAELVNVPVLGRSILVGGHVLVDRTNLRSQMNAYKAGVQWLKKGVNLVTFPEGTRSKNGRMGSFKKGAFKMAQTLGAPVIPMSINYADKVQPVDFAFPAKSSLSRPRARIKIGKPVETDGKSDDELMEEVWRSIAEGLPDSQKPAKGTPIAVK